MTDERMPYQGISLHKRDDIRSDIRLSTFQDDRRIIRARYDPESWCEKLYNIGALWRSGGRKETDIVTYWLTEEAIMGLGINEENKRYQEWASNQFSGIPEFTYFERIPLGNQVMSSRKDRLDFLRGMKTYFSDSQTFGKREFMRFMIDTFNVSTNYSDILDALVDNGIVEVRILEEKRKAIYRLSSKTEELLV